MLTWVGFSHPFKRKEFFMRTKKTFDNVIPVTKNTKLAGELVNAKLIALQAEYVASRFNAPIGKVLQDDIISSVGNSESRMVRFPAYNLYQLTQAFYNDFFRYALHHGAFKDVPVLAQYEFPDFCEKYINIFVLGGDDKFMFVICEDYQNDKVFMQQITSMPRAGKVPMEQVANSSVKKVSDIWNYHYNAFMGFGVF